MSKTREQLNDWLKQFDVTGKTVLDMGAGRPRAWLFGNFEGKKLTPKVSGTPKEYKTADYDEQWGCDFQVDLNKPFTDEQVKEMKSDCVFCMETMEHIRDPIQTIKNLSAVTKEKLFISVPFVNPIHDIHDYLRYTLQYFQTVLPKYGFKTVNIKRRTSETIRDWYKTEGMRMSKVTLRQGYADNIRDIGYMVEAIK